MQRTHDRGRTEERGTSSASSRRALTCSKLSFWTDSAAVSGSGCERAENRGRLALPRNASAPSVSCRPDTSAGSAWNDDALCSSVMGGYLCSSARAGKQAKLLIDVQETPGVECAAEAPGSCTAVWELVST